MELEVELELDNKFCSFYFSFYCLIFTAHLVIANKVVNIWKIFVKARTWVTRHYSNKKKAENSIYKFPERETCYTW